MAQKRGRLSPVLAGHFAMKLGENPEHWIAVAALEAEPESSLLEELKAHANKWRKRLLKNNEQGPIFRALLFSGLAKTAKEVF